MLEDMEILKQPGRENVRDLVRDANPHVQPRFELKSLVDFVAAMYPDDRAREVPFTEIPEEHMKEALMSMNCGEIRAALVPSIMNRYPGYDSSIIERVPEINELFRLLDSLVESAYDVSSIINQGTFRAQDLEEPEKLVVNKASKTMAELVELTGYDTETALRMKMLFVELMLQNFVIHRHRNYRLGDSVARSAQAYMNSERFLLKGMQDYLDAWMRGAVDVEVSLKAALAGVSGIDRNGIETPGVRDDVENGVDLWFRLDWDGLAGKRVIPPAIYKSQADKRMLTGRMALQIKSRVISNEEKDSRSVQDIRLAFRGGRENPDAPEAWYRRDEETGQGYYLMTVGVETTPDCYRFGEVRYGDSDGDRIRVSQIDFEKVIPELRQSGLDKIPEVIFNRHDRFRRERAQHSPHPGGRPKR